MQPEGIGVPIAATSPNRRALVLPGGGMRVAYQAGVVKALYDVGLRFSYADGASGGTMNLAALLSGLTPDQLCARWRTLDVARFISMRPLAAYLRFPSTGALGDFDGIEQSVFPHLGIDAGRVRAARRIQATFNVCCFDDKVVVPVPHTEISHELLLAGISLPLMTPPIRYQGRTWTDAVWIQDSNLLAAVKAGANELWVAWCIGNTPEFKAGLLEQYVHMIEMAALGHLHDELAAIREINARIEAGEKPYGHSEPIAVHLIRPRVPIPLDPDFLTGKVDAATLISYGYRDAVRYLAGAQEEGVELGPRATRMSHVAEGVAFREVMSGRITFGETDPARGYASHAAVPVDLRGTIDVRDIKELVQDPQHTGELAGHLVIHRRGGWLPAATGRFGLFAPSGDPALSYMVYEMGVRMQGRPHWFSGRKHVRFALPWKLWGATTTLYVKLHEGEDESGPVVAAGILHLGIPALLSLLGTMHATECVGLRARSRAVYRFFRFFAAELFRTYVRRRPV